MRAINTSKWEKLKDIFAHIEQQAVWERLALSVSFNISHSPGIEHAG
jgi:hypothetical protein